MHHFEHYDYFLEIMKTKSITKAADKLLLSQPYLSQYLLRLETELNVSLFDRSHHPISLTEDGEIYLSAITKFIELNKHMEDSFQNDSNTLSSISVGMSNWRANYLLPVIMSKFSALYPNIKIELYEKSFDSLQELVKKDALDICIMSALYTSSAYTCDLLLNERVLLAVPINHPIVRTSGRDVNDRSIVPVNLELIKQQPYIMPHEGSFLRKTADMLFDKYSINPKAITTTSNPATALSMVAAGVGLTITFELAVKYFVPNEKIYYFSFETPNITYPFTIIYKKNIHAEPFSKLINIFHEVCS